jgi:hypothetical protein
MIVGAKDAYEEALKVEPGNVQAKSGLKAVDDAIKREAQEDGQDPDLGLGKVSSKIGKIIDSSCLMIRVCLLRLLEMQIRDISLQTLHSCKNYNWYKGIHNYCSKRLCRINDL